MKEKSFCIYNKLYSPIYLTRLVILFILELSQDRFEVRRCDIPAVDIHLQYALLYLHFVTPYQYLIVPLVLPHYLHH